MTILGLDGKTYNWTMRHRRPTNSSELHRQIKSLLLELFPVDPILEEVSLPGCGRHTLYADFYLPHRKLMIECQGRQHYEYVPHFHVNKVEFAMSRVRDKLKSQWCDTNGITLVKLSYESAIDEWTRQIIEI